MDTLFFAIFPAEPVPRSDTAKLKGRRARTRVLAKKIKKGTTTELVLNMIDGIILEKVTKIEKCKLIKSKNCEILQI